MLGHENPHVEYMEAVGYQEAAGGGLRDQAGVELREGPQGMEVGLGSFMLSLSVVSYG
jgi:hypothetical protein